HRNFVLNELVLELVDEHGAATAVRPSAARADHEQRGERDWVAPGTIDGDAATGWAIAGGEGRAHVLLVELEPPLAVPASSTLRVRLEQGYGSGDRKSVV